MRGVYIRDHVPRTITPALLNNKVVAIFGAECPPMFGPASRAGVLTEIVRTITLSYYNPEHRGSLGDGSWKLGERPSCSDVGTLLSRDIGTSVRKGVTSVQAEHARADDAPHQARARTRLRVHITRSHIVLDHGSIHWGLQSQCL